MITFTYILLWVLIGIYACGIIYNHKLENSYKKLKEMADRRQRSADELYNAAMDVMTEKHKLIAYENIRKILMKRSAAMQTNLHLITDINKSSIEAIVNTVEAAEQERKDEEIENNHHIK